MPLSLLGKKTVKMQAVRVSTMDAELEFELPVSERVNRIGELQSMKVEAFARFPMGSILYRNKLYRDWWISVRFTYTVGLLTLSAYEIKWILRLLGATQTHETEMD